MKPLSNTALAAAAAGLLAIGALPGCDDGDDDVQQATSDNTPQAQTPRQSDSSAAKTRNEGRAGRRGKAAGGPLRLGDVPLVKRYGKPESGRDRDEILTVARAFYRARARSDWARVCALMTPDARAALRKTSTTRGPALEDKPCPEVMVAFVLAAGKTAAELRKDHRQTSFFQARIDGDRAFALYKTSHGSRGILPIARIDGTWKVAAPRAVPL